MTEAKRDENRVPVWMGVSSVDGETPIPLTINPITGRLRVMVAGFSDWSVKYEATELPDAATPAWTKAGDATMIEISPAGYLHVVSSTAILEYIRAGLSFDDTVGATMEARLKVVSGQIWDGLNANGCSAFGLFSLRNGIVIYSDAICFFNAPDNKYAMNTTDDYHIYRFTAKDGIARAYVDGVLRLTGTIISETYTYLEFSPEYMGIANIETSWDYVYYRTDGAFAPVNNKAKRDANRVTVKIGEYDTEIAALSADPTNKGILMKGQYG